MSFNGNNQDPKPTYRFELISTSTKSEYPVNDLCTKQKLNTSDSAKIKTDGSSEHPTIVSANINSNPQTANNV